MSVYSVDIASVRVGEDSIPVPPTIKKRLNRTVGDFLRTIPVPSPELGIEIQPDRLDLYVGNKIYPITNSEAQSVAGKLNRYVAHQRHASVPADIETQRSQRIVETLYKGAPKGVRGRMATAMDVISNTSTTIQKAQQASDLLKGKELIVSQAAQAFGFLNGAIWLSLGSGDFYTGQQDLIKSREIGDREGVLRGKARMWSARSVWIGALFDVADQATHLASSSQALQTATKGLEIVATNFFGWSSLIGIAMAVLSLFRCIQFRDRLLIDYLDNDKTLSDPKKVRAAVKWLQDQVGVNPEERERIHSEILKEGRVAPEGIDEELDQRVNRLAQKKIACFKRRTSLKAARLVLAASGPGQVLGVKEAKELIREVLSQNQKKVILNIITIAAAILGLAAMICGSLAGLQAVSYILFASSTGIYAVVGAVGLFSALVWRDNEAPVNGFPGLEFVPTHIG